MPNKEFSFEYLDKLTQKPANKSTWWPPALIEVQKMGLKVAVIKVFDYDRFCRGRTGICFKPFRLRDRRLALKTNRLAGNYKYDSFFLRLVNFKRRPATMAAIDDLLADSWLVGLELNARRLQNRPGFSSHMVVIFDKQNHKYFMQDPGLPPPPNLEIGTADLRRIWLNKNSDGTALFAIRT